MIIYNYLKWDLYYVFMGYIIKLLPLRKHLLDKTFETLFQFNHLGSFYYGSKIFKSCNLGYDMISNFHLQDRTTSPFDEVTFHILCLDSTQAEATRF